jgi:ankyrin repeat protein
MSMPRFFSPTAVQFFAAIRNSDAAGIEKLLVAEPDLVSVPNREGQPPLHQAVQLRDAAMVKLLLDKGAGINAVNGDKQAALHAAVWSRQEEMAKLLIERGADVNAQSALPHNFTMGMVPAQTPLLAAYTAGSPTLVKLLIEKGAKLDEYLSSVNLKTGDLLLREAVDSGDIELVKYLLGKTKAPRPIVLLKQPIHRGDKAMVELLLDNGVPLNAPPTNGDEGPVGRDGPLFWAIRWAPKEILPLLLARGASLKTIGVGGQTPLTAAIGARDVDAVKLLLDKVAAGAGAVGAENEAIKTGAVRIAALRTALYYQDRAMVEMLVKAGVPHQDSLLDAVLRGDLERVKKLAPRRKEEGGEDRSSFADKVGALHVAAFTGHVEIMQWLLQNGFEVEAKTRAGQTPLHFAVLSGHAPVVKLLLDKGAAMETRDHLGQAPLHLAALAARPDIVTLLLDKGAKVDAAIMSEGPIIDGGAGLALAKGTTPLLRAALAGNSAVVAVLLERGANATVADARGQTALFAAARSRDVQSLKLLLDKGADAAQRDKLGRNAAHYLVEGVQQSTVVWSHPMPPLSVVKNSRPALDLLMERGLKIAQRDTNAIAPIDIALRAGDTSLVTLLLEKGVDINKGNFVRTPMGLEFPGAGYKKPGYEGATPLHQAAAAGDVAMAKLLLARGADPNIEDAFGRTALDLAERRGEMTPNYKDFPFAPTTDLGFHPLMDASGSDDVLKPPVFQTGKIAIAEMLRAKGGKHGAGPFFEAVRNGAAVVVQAALKENPALATEQLQLNHSVNGEGGYLRFPPLPQAQPVVATPGSTAPPSTPTTAPAWPANVLPVPITITPLALAVRAGHLGVTKLLLEQGAAREIITAKSDPGGILHSSAGTRSVPLVRLLLDSGFPVDMRNNIGKTALHTAAGTGDEAMVSLLIERGADVNAKDNAGRTPLNYAASAPRAGQPLDGNTPMIPGPIPGTLIPDPNAPLRTSPGIGTITTSTTLPDGRIVQSSNNPVAQLIIAKGGKMADTATTPGGVTIPGVTVTRPGN